MIHPLVLKFGVAAFACTTFFLILDQRERDRDRLAQAESELSERNAEIRRARSELAAAELVLEHDDAAFRELYRDHRELQDLHLRSMDWGPLRAPRDCVREVILTDDRAWPTDRDAELAYEIKAHDWCEDQRAQLNEELDACFGVAFPDARPPRPDPRAGDADSSWVDWPEGFVVEPFPKLGGGDGR